MFKNVWVEIIFTFVFGAILLLISKYFFSTLDVIHAFLVYISFEYIKNTLKLYKENNFIVNFLGRD